MSHLQSISWDTSLDAACNMQLIICIVQSNRADCKETDLMTKLCSGHLDKVRIVLKAFHITLGQHCLLPCHMIQLCWCTHPTLQYCIIAAWFVTLYPIVSLTYNSMTVASRQHGYSVPYMAKSLCPVCLMCCSSYQGVSEFALTIALTRCDAALQSLPIINSHPTDLGV